MTYKKINFIFGFGKASINIDTPLVELYRNKSHMILLYGYLETINDSPWQHRRVEHRYLFGYKMG